MNPALREAIVSGDANITISVNAADLRSIINEMAHAERARIAEEAERRKETPCLTRKQVAEKLRVHENTVKSLEQRGELTPERIGAKIRFRLSDIEDYLNINRQKPA